MYLDEMKEGEEIFFDELLLFFKVIEENYLLVVRFLFNVVSVFLKRSLNELRINNYNFVCLRVWRVNMDIQYVLDVYVCVVYIVNYILKG